MRTTRRQALAGIVVSTLPFPAVSATTAARPVVLIIRGARGNRDHAVEYADGRCIMWLTREKAEALRGPTSDVALVREDRGTIPPTWGVSQGDETVATGLIDRRDAVAIAERLAGNLGMAPMREVEAPGNAP
jgi:hypothetical protein